MRTGSSFHPAVGGGLVVMIGAFVVYLMGSAVDVAAASALGVIGLFLFLRGMKQLPGTVVYAVSLAVGLFFVFAGGMLLWTMGLASTPQARESYGLPFMALSMPWYVAGDLGVFFVILGAASVFVAGLGLGRGVRR